MSTRATEATLLLIKAKTDNLDVALSTRLNTLGQKAMAASAPVVIASDQSTIQVKTENLQTYSANIVGLVPAALATDIFTITGSAGKVVKIRALRVTATRTANGTIDVLLVKRSAANTLGTSTAPTRVPNDSSNAAATATVLAYTANPTLGTLVGTFKGRKMFINASGTGGSDVSDWDFDQNVAQPPTVRGIAEVIAVNLNGVTIAGGSFDIAIEWTEE